MVYFLSTRGSDVDAIRVDVAGASSVSGAGPIPLEVLATRAELDRLHERLVGGYFHVGIEAFTSLTGDDAFSVTPMIDFRARALCD